MNVNIEIVFLDFLINDFWTYMAYDLDGSIHPWAKAVEGAHQHSLQ